MCVWFGMRALNFEANGIDFNCQDLEGGFHLLSPVMTFSQGKM